jgi:hypothetical protein
MLKTYKAKQVTTNQKKINGGNGENINRMNETFANMQKKLALVSKRLYFVFCGARV